MTGGPWYHEQLTEQAAAAAGFSHAAADELAWHADYIDSYLYNPLWWVQGGLERFRVAMATAVELEKLHFDDNLSTGDAVAAWRRYTSGALAGVLWAADRNDVSAARNILGVSLHAIQDFHAHSNWVDDPERRGRTFFDTPRTTRDADWLYTGTYELPDHLGVPVHGKLAPQCLVLTQQLVIALLEPACLAFSPLSNDTICHTYRACRDDSSAGSPATVLGVPVPAGVAYYNPPGIALDSRWMANIAVQQRGLIGVTGAQLFDQAYALALRSSEQWLRAVESELTAAGKAAFWNQVRGAQTYSRESEYEHFDRLPYQFMSVGPYPDDEQGTQWFLRVTLETGSDSGAGTDADVTLQAQQSTFVLDYAPDETPLLTHDDFEAGSRAVYTVGPFATYPTSITLTNDATNLEEIAEALGNEFEAAFLSVLWAVGDVLLSLVGGWADLIATNDKFWSPAQLAAIGTSQSFSIRLDGGTEGDYRVHGTITRSAGSSTATYSILLHSVECLRESDWDRFTFSDEPFFLIVLTPAPGTISKRTIGPLQDVDAGESFPIAVGFNVSLPVANSSLALAIRAMESDGETPYHRDQLLNELAGTIDDATEETRQSLTEAIAAGIAADWKLRRIQVHAFTRGDQIRSGTVLDQTVDHWLAGNSTRTYALGPAPAVRVRSLFAIDQAFLAPSAALLTH